MPLIALVNALRRRLIGLAALTSTLLVLLILLTRVDPEMLLAGADFDLSASQLVPPYLALVALAALFFAFEPRLRASLSHGRGAGLLLALASASAVGAVRLNLPDQPLRLFNYRFTVWVVIVHIVLLGGLMALLVVRDPWGAAGQRVGRWAALVAGGFGLAVAAWSVASLSHFMQLDLPDEAWMGSVATHYAATGRLSPSFAGFVYGDPDPVMSHYYAVMGVWVRLAGSSLAALRAFPLMVTGIAAGVVALTLWRVRSLARHQRVMGLVTFAGLSAVVRVSHNLRMDAGLSLYGALLLMGLLFYLEGGAHHRRWLALAGAALLVGVESIVTAALITAAVAGLVIVLHSVKRPLRPGDWTDAAIYASACAIVGLVYAALHFLPDVAANWTHYRQFSAHYASAEMLGGAPSFHRFVDYFLRFSVILSPVEWAVVLGALAIAVWRGPAADRWLAVIVGLSLLLFLLLIDASYGYLTLFGPFVAYGVARAARYQVVTVLGAFVLIPALLAAPIFDMAHDTRQALGQRAIEEADRLSAQIPAGVTVVGEDIFWFTLHERNLFIGWPGVEAYAREHDVSWREAVGGLGADLVICLETHTAHCDAADPARYELATTFMTARGTHRVYHRR